MRHATLQRLEKLEADNNPEPGPLIIIIRPIVDSEGRDITPAVYHCPQLHITVEKDIGEAREAFFDRMEDIVREAGDKHSVLQLHPVMNIA